MLASGYAETGEDGARRQRELLAAAGAHAPARAQHHRPRQPDRQHPAVGQRRVGDGRVSSRRRSASSRRAAASSARCCRGPPAAASACRSSSRPATRPTSRSPTSSITWPTIRRTSVIALYIESVRDPDKFRAAALKAAAAGKPIVAYKIGRIGSRRQGGGLAYRRAGRQRPHVRCLLPAGRRHPCRRTSPTCSTSRWLSRPGRRLRGKRVAILTSTGGAGTLVPDSLGLAGFETPPPDAATAARLRALLTGRPGRARPQSDRRDAGRPAAGRCCAAPIAALLDSPSYDALTIIVGSSGVASPELMADAVQACLPAQRQAGGRLRQPARAAAAALLTARGVPAFTAPESCAAALAGAAGASASWHGTGCRQSSTAIGSADLPTSRGRARRGASQGAVRPLRRAVRARADRHDRRPRPSARRMNSAGAWCSRSCRREITHKSDVGGVAVGVAAGYDRRAARRRWRRQSRPAPARRRRASSCRRWSTGGVELILGVQPRSARGRRFCSAWAASRPSCSTDTTLRLLPAGGGLTARRGAGHGARAEILAAARRLPRAAEGRCRRAGVGDRGVLADGGALARSPASKPRSIRCSCCQPAKASGQRTGLPCSARDRTARALLLSLGRGAMASAMLTPAHRSAGDGENGTARQGRKFRGGVT